MFGLSSFDLALFAAGTLVLVWALTYILVVAFGEFALRRGVPKAQRTHTFVGTPMGDGYYAPFRAFAYFRDGGFAGQRDPAIVRRSARVRALVRVNDALLYPAIIGVAAVLVADWMRT